MKKILVSYNSVGLGHKVVAENIAQALKKYPGYQIELLDILKLYEGRFTKTSTKIYEFIIQHLPGLWRFFYLNRVFHFLTLPLRIPFASLKAGRLREYLHQLEPDLILTTHPNATALVVYLKKHGDYRGKIATTFSDFHFQPYWVFPLVDKYLVMTRELKEQVESLGFAGNQVVVTGLPVNEAFVKDYNLAEIYKEFGLARTRPIVLVMGGSRSWGIKLADIKALLGSDFDVQLVVLVSLNQTLYGELVELAKSHPGNLKILGNLSSIEVAKLFSVAKILVTKPGGLTVGQALLKNLPMVLANPLPAVEELNQSYLASQQAVVIARDSAEVRSWTERLLLDKKFYQEIKDHMKALAVPDAAARAAEVIIDMLEM